MYVVCVWHGLGCMCWCALCVLVCCALCDHVSMSGIIVSVGIVGLWHCKLCMTREAVLWVWSGSWVYVCCVSVIVEWSCGAACIGIACVVVYVIGYCV